MRDHNQRAARFVIEVVRGRTMPKTPSRLHDPKQWDRTRSRRRASVFTARKSHEHPGIVPDTSTRGADQPALQDRLCCAVVSMLARQTFALSTQHQCNLIVFGG